MRNYAYRVPPSEAKRLNTLIARACLIGVTVQCIEGDFGLELIASRWALTKSFPSLDALEAWLDGVADREAP